MATRIGLAVVGTDALVGGPGGTAVEPGAAGGGGGVAVGTPVGSATPSALLVTDIAGNLVSGPLTSSVVTGSQLGLTSMQADVVAPLPSGDATGATDVANLLASVAATPVGGKLFIRNGNYLLNAPFTVNKQITVEGQAAGGNWGTVTGGGGTNSPVNGLTGVVLTQLTAATDVVQVTASGSVHLRNLCATFGPAVICTGSGHPGSTGHGFNATPSQMYLTGHDDGVLDATWTNLYVLGHDGNHYGYVWMNPIVMTFYHLHSYGGGGFLIQCDSAYTNYGNCSWFDSFITCVRTGTAHAVDIRGGGSQPGAMNLLQFWFPSIQGGASSSQYMWRENLGTAAPSRVLIVHGDLETGTGMPVQFSTTTQHLSVATYPSDRDNLGLGGAVYGGLGVVGLSSTVTGAGNVMVGNSAGGAIVGGSYNIGVGVQTLAANVAGQANTAVGYQALMAGTGNHNTTIGYQAGIAISTAAANTAIGSAALAANISGDSNVAIGRQALALSTTTAGNTAVGTGALANYTGTVASVAVGFNALNLTTTGINNTAVGSNALTHNVTGAGNTAVGYNALTLSTGSSNTAVGIGALQAALGSNNTAVGSNALQADAGSSSTAVGANALKTYTGAQATAIGFNALQASTTGADNCAAGAAALSGLTTGAQNTAVGSSAGVVPNPTILGSLNVFVGYRSGMASTGDYSNTTAIGSNAQVNGANATAVGYKASAGAAGAVAIGCDNANTGASTVTANVIALGTALHQVQVSNNTTGAGSALLAANCPAVTPAAPYTWLKMMSSDGSTVYVPAWK